MPPFTTIQTHTAAAEEHGKTALVSRRGVQGVEQGQQAVMNVLHSAAYV